MKIIALNKGIEGYSDEIEMTKEGFNGHQVGVAICILGENREMVNNFTHSSDEFVNDLISDSKVLLVEKGITQLIDGNLTPRTIYYLPYYVANHSVLSPTVNNDNISGACNVTYNVEIELLFVEDELNRYAVARFSSRNVSIMDLVHAAFEDGMEEDELLQSIGIHYGLSEDEEEGYILDFYDEAGEMYNLCFSNIERLRDAIVSMRLIKCECIIDKN